MGANDLIVFFHLQLCLAHMCGLNLLSNEIIRCHPMPVGLSLAVSYLRTSLFC
uniref:Uncharacterized protein n=1 Tax=Arundo donax TaxID=35708 RepID=A0A0A9SQU0_ARUDO